MPGVGAPRKVTSVTLDIPAKELVVNIELEPRIKWIHPETKQPANIHRWTERPWRDLHNCSFATIIKAEDNVRKSENRKLLSADDSTLSKITP